MILGVVKGPKNAFQSQMLACQASRMTGIPAIGMPSLAYTMTCFWHAKKRFYMPLGNCVP